MTRTRFQLVAFDLDGTLVDSAPDIAGAVNAMLAEFDRPPRSVDEVRHFLGNGVEWLTRRALTGELWAEPDPALLAPAHERLLFHYSRINGEGTRVYPGVFETLDVLHRAGVTAACLTNKNRRFTEPLLAALDLADRFEVVVCGDDLPEKKPDPAPLQQVMSRAGADADRTLMVGDSVTDVRTARAAGTAVAGVTYGYNHGEPIAAADPDWVVDSLTEIRTILRGIDRQACR